MSENNEWTNKLSIIIPAFNEAEGISDTLHELRLKVPNSEIIVVDDGSTDATARKAVMIPGVRLIHHRFNAGYGASLKTGMRHSNCDFVAWFDADCEHKVDDLMAMTQQLAEKGLAAVIAQRNRAGQPAIRFYGKFLLRLVARSLKFEAGPDLNCGLRVFRRDVIRRYVHLLPNGFSASLTSTMVMVERGYPIAFHPITVSPRKGLSKVKLRDGFATTVQILRMIMLFAPLRIFLRGGLLAMGIGTGYGLWIAVRYGRGFPVAASLVIVAGLLLCMLGLVADQISQLRMSAFEPTIDSEEISPKEESTGHSKVKI